MIHLITNGATVLLRGWRIKCIVVMSAHSRRSIMYPSIRWIAFYVNNISKVYPSSSWEVISFTLHAYSCQIIVQFHYHMISRIRTQVATHTEAYHMDQDRDRSGPLWGLEMLYLSAKQRQERKMSSKWLSESFSSPMCLPLWSRNGRCCWPGTIQQGQLDLQWQNGGTRIEHQVSPTWHPSKKVIGPNVL